MSEHVYPLGGFEGSGVCGRLTAELSRLLQAQGYWSQPVVPQGRSARVDEFDKTLDTWREQPPAGVVLQYPTPGLADRIDDALPAHPRRIAVYRDDAATPAGWPRVNWSVDAGMKAVAHHLIALGHRRIGVVANQRPARIDPSLRKRTQGHTRQVLALGHTLREAGVHHGLTLHYNDNRHQVLDRAEIDRIADWLQQASRPTAVVGSDFRLIAVRRAAEQLGLRVPGDLALVGIGNTPWAEALNVSSLAVREDLAARHVARLITAEPWQFDGASQHVELEPRLVIRASCGGDAEAAPNAALTGPAATDDADAPRDFDVFAGV